MKIILIVIAVFFAGVFWRDIKYFTIDFLYFAGRGVYSALWVAVFCELNPGYRRIDALKLFPLLLLREIFYRINYEWWEGSEIDLPKWGKKHG
jgi:hypothetical protein